jgi:hypothetical protein
MRTSTVTATRSLALAALSAFAPVLHAAGCDKAVGHWSWFTGADVVMQADHSLLSDGKTLGTWDCTYIGGAVLTLRWKATGGTDTVTITTDGKALSGANQIGTQVWGTRAQSASDSHD